MGFRIQRHSRLRNRTFFKKVYEQGRFLSNQLITVHFFPHPGHVHRIGFTAGKRLGNAVVRNRCKRRMKECYRLFREEVPEEFDMILVARKGIIDAEWNNVVAAYRDILRLARLVISKNG